MPLPLAPGTTFDHAARAVLSYLRQHVPMAFWSVTRLENGRQTYLYLGENDYGLEQGRHHPWEHSLCVRMLAGDGPPVAPDTSAVPAYAEAGIQASLRVGAYAGAGICEPDGQLFGALCGLHPEARRDDERLAAAGPLLGLLATLLSTVLAADRARQQAADLALEARLVAETDALTGLFNRRAWERVLAEGQQTFSRLGDPTALAVVDLDRLKEVNDRYGHAAGDEHLREAAATLLRAAHGTDVVARLGGDEFGLLLRGCDEDAAGRRVADLRDALTAAGVPASVGWAPLTHRDGLQGALADADRAMYQVKRARRAIARRRLALERSGQAQLI